MRETNEREARVEGREVVLRKFTSGDVFEKMTKFLNFFFFTMKYSIDKGAIHKSFEHICCAVFLSWMAGLFYQTCRTFVQISRVHTSARQASARAWSSLVRAICRRF
jgi:hypothetical protein